MEIIARAVHHIHLCGQLHLDLKPSNILLDGDAGAAWDAVTPKVADFGIARTVGSGTTDTGAAGPGGTPSYMAPEQIAGARKDLSAAADIHGLGAILYHMLTGRPPYQGATILETVDLVKRHDPIPPRRLNPRIPSDLETICLKCLEKGPSQRYASAALLADDLWRWLGGHPIQARPASSIEKGWRWCRRRPVVAALAAALVLTLSVGIVAVTLLWRQSASSASRAEENLRRSHEILGDLIDLSFGGKSGLSKVMTLDQRISVLGQIRRQLHPQASKRPDDLVLADRLASIEFGLGSALMQGSRFIEAQSLALDSLARFEALASQHPANSMFLWRRARCLGALAELNETMREPDKSVDYQTRLVQLCERQCRLALDPESCVELLNARHALAWLLFKRRNREQAGALFAANRRLLENPPPGYEGRINRIARISIDIDCKLGMDVSRSPGTRETERHQSHDPGPLSRLCSLTDETQAPPEWARVAAELLRCGIDPQAASAAHRESEDALLLVGQLVPRASLFRQVKDIDRADRVVDRIMALAQLYLAMDSSQPAAAPDSQHCVHPTLQKRHPKRRPGHRGD